MDKKKFYKGPSNVVYNIDGASFGMDERLVEAIQASVRTKLQQGTLVIPRLPQVAARILQLAQDPDVPVQEVTRAIMSDAVLAARVLGIANSAAYGGTGHVGGLAPAITRLGTKTICNIVFTESVQTKVFPARSYRNLLEQSWRRSLGAALACESIARLTGLEREGAFLLGLLHDLGQPTLVTAISEYERKNDGRPLGDEIVEIVLSQLHEEVGAHVLEKWEMPAPIVEGARAHHRYLGASSPPAHKIIVAANLVCQHLGIGSEQCAVSFNLEHVFGDLGLADLDKVGRILEAVSRDVETLLSGFGSTAAARA